MKKFSVFTIVTLIVWGAVGLQGCRPKDDQQGNNAEINQLDVSKYTNGKNIGVQNHRNLDFGFFRGFDGGIGSALGFGSDGMLRFIILVFSMGVGEVNSVTTSFALGYWRDSIFYSFDEVKEAQKMGCVKDRQVEFLENRLLGCFSNVSRPSEALNKKIFRYGNIKITNANSCTQYIGGYNGLEKPMKQCVADAKNKSRDQAFHAFTRLLQGALKKTQDEFQQLAKENLPQKRNPELENKLNAEAAKAADEIQRL